MASGLDCRYAPLVIETILQERTLQSLLRSVAVPGVRCHQLAQKFQTGLTVFLNNRLLVELNLDVLYPLFFRYACKGVVTHEEHVCDYSEAEDIALIAVGLVEHGVVEEDLGSNVARGSTFAVAVVLHFFIGDQGQSEVDEFGLETLSAEDDVMRFDVPMDDVLAVALLEGAQDVCKEFFHFGQGNLLLLIENVHHVGPRHIV